MRRISISSQEHKNLLKALRERDELKRQLGGRDRDVKALEYQKVVYKEALKDICEAFDKNKHRCSESLCRQYKENSPPALPAGL